MAETRRPSTGTVKWFNARKGFGFIAADDGGEDLFVHQTTIRSDGFRTLSEGQPVEFIVDFTEDGRAKAVEVVPVSRSRPPLSGRVGQGARRGSRGGRMRGGGVGDGGRGFDNYWRGSRGGRFGSGVGGRCYNCGRMGHMARDCYYGGDGDGASGNRIYNGGGGRGAGGSRRHDGGGGGYSGGGGRCYNCGRMGHMARDCYHGGDGGGTSENRRYNGSGGAGGSRRYDGGGSGYSGGDGGGGGRSRRGCYNCGEDGHFARDCPNREQE